MLKKVLKNERGLTLIELLAVIVILGIISAIAVPSIGGLIDNSKKDAHVANAQQMINAAKLAAATDEELIKTGDTSSVIYLKDLVDNGYLEPMEDPDSSSESEKYNTDQSYVKVNKTNNKFSYSVKLVGSKREIQETLENELSRDSVIDIDIAE